MGNTWSDVPAPMDDGGPRVLLREFFTDIGGRRAEPRRQRITAAVRLAVGLTGVFLPTLVHHGRELLAAPDSAPLRAVTLAYAALVVAYLPVNVGAFVLSRARPRAAEAASMAAIVIEITANQLTHYKVGSANGALLYFPVVLVAAYRVFLDYRSALLAGLLAVALYAATATAEVTGLVPLAPALAPPPPIYAHAGGVVRQVLVHTIGLTLAFAAVNYGVNQSVKLHRYITESVLRRYLPPSLVTRAAQGTLRLDDPPVRRTVTVMFMDLVGFTEMSERLGPDRVAAVLNRYLSLMADLAHRHEATIDKFVGDAIMIVFGAPDPLAPEAQARKCVALALEVVRSLQDLDDPPLRVRIGINTGEAVVGHFGSRARSDFTVIGPSVNVAARLETASRPGRILVGAATATLLHDTCPLEPPIELALKGVARPIRAYFVAADTNA